MRLRLVKIYTGHILKGSGMTDIALEAKTMRNQRLAESFMEAVVQARQGIPSGELANIIDQFMVVYGVFYQSFILALCGDTRSRTDLTRGDGWPASLRDYMVEQSEAIANALAKNHQYTAITLVELADAFDEQEDERIRDLWLTVFAGLKCVLTKLQSDGGADADEESGAEPKALSELVTLSQVEPLCGLRKRTLERHLSVGTLPRPDVPGGGGRSHKWYWHNLRPALEKVSRKPLPEKFPGSRILADN